MERGSYRHLIHILNESLNQLDMSNSVCCYGNVLWREEG